jgi:hypothetical protein
LPFCRDSILSATLKPSSRTKGNKPDRLRFPKVAQKTVFLVRANLVFAGVNNGIFGQVGTGRYCLET